MLGSYNKDAKVIHCVAVSLLPQLSTIWRMNYFNVMFPLSLEKSNAYLEESRLFSMFVLSTTVETKIDLKHCNSIFLSIFLSIYLYLFYTQLRDLKWLRNQHHFNDF